MTNEELAVMIQAGERDKVLELWAGVRRYAYKRADHWAYALNGCGGVTVEDLHQAAFLALLDALERWEAGRGSFIGCYAFALKSAYKKTAGLITQRDRRDPLRNALSLDAPVGDDEDEKTLGDYRVDPTAEAALDNIAERDWAERLHDALEEAIVRLPENEAEAVRAKYYQGGPADKGMLLKAMRRLRHPAFAGALRAYL